MTMELLTLGLMLITAVYAYFTYQILQVTKESVLQVIKQTEAISKPYINIEAFNKSGQFLIYLNIENKGITSAENVSLTLDKEYYICQKKDKKLNDLKLFSKKILSIHPNERFIVLLDKAPDIFSEININPLEFKIQINYEFSGKKYSEYKVIDLQVLQGIQLNSNSSIEEFQKIRKSIDGVANSLNKVEKKLVDLQTNQNANEPVESVEDFETKNANLKKIINLFR